MDEHNPDGDRRDAANSTGTGLYGEIESLPVTVDAVSLEGKHIETEDRTFERTIIRVRGDGSTGFGEDVTRSLEAHKRLRKDGLTLPTGD